MGRFGQIVEELKNMTPAEKRQAVVDAGIIDRKGNLNEAYKKK